MVISDEERREIAANLRESRDFISVLPSASLEQNAFDTFERILACVDYEQGNIFDYLADLIDRPTCQMVECTIDHSSRSWGMRCTACGKEFEHMKPSYGWHYCPSCGAEVGE